MEMVRNKASGKSFIVLDDTGGPHFLLITPEGKVKWLDRRLFEAEVAVDPEGSQWRRYVTKVQMEKYVEYTEHVA